jgi:membrane protease YdiL (CAAX protease family)
MNYLFPDFHKKSPLSKLLFLLLIIIVSLFITTLLGLVIAVPFYGLDVLKNMGSFTNIHDENTISFIKYFQAINQLGVFVIPAFLYAYLEKNKAIDYLWMNRKINFQSLLFSILILLSTLPAISWMVEINEQMKLPGFLSGLENWMKESEEKTKLITNIFLDVTTISGLLINLFIIAFLAAMGEELLFRGIVLKLLAESTKNIHMGIFISAALFSALHLQFYGFMPRMALGIIFGYIFVWSGNLWVPIILHFLFNGMTVVASYLYNMGIISSNPDSLGSSSNFVVVSVSFLISIGFMFLFYQRKGKANSSVFLQQKKEESPFEDSSL